MSTRASALGARPAANPMLVGLWLAAVAMVLATVVAGALMVGRAIPTRTEPAKGPALSRSDTTAPGLRVQLPFEVNGKICGQCR